jgi:hypothetical protein
VSNKVNVVGAPGFPEPFRATLIPGLDAVQLAGEKEPYAVVSTEAGELLAVPSRCVEELPEERTIAAIAREIRADWTNVNYGAVPYLDAMDSLRTVNDRYGADSAPYIVRYFLANATTWRGEKARAIKKELNAMIKGRY